MFVTSRLVAAASASCSGRSAASAPKTLSDRLRRLEDAGVVTRACFAEMPPRVEYRLTDKGLALLGVIESMRDFGVTWLAATAADPSATVDSRPKPTTLMGVIAANRCGWLTIICAIANQETNR